MPLLNKIEEQDKKIKYIVNELKARNTLNQQERDAVLAVSIATTSNTKQDFLKLAYCLTGFLEEFARKGYSWSIYYLQVSRRFITDKKFREKVIRYADYVVYFSRADANK